MGARFFVGALVVALACAIWLPSQGSAGGAVALESALVVIGIGAGLAAASSAGSLSEDRGSGVHAWLAATACPKAVLRAAPAVAGVVVTVAVTLGASLLAVTMLASSGLSVPTRQTTLLRVSERRYGKPVTFVTDFGPSTVDVPTLSTSISDLDAHPGSKATLELDVRPHYADPGAAAVGSVDVSFGAPGASDRGRATIPVRGRSDVEVLTARGFTFESEDGNVDLSVVSARRIDGPASFFANVMRAGLLLGLALASIAPIAVLLSRFLSAASAVTAALVLGGVGVLHGPLLALGADAQGVEAASIASAILRGATWLAPDLSVVSGASEAMVGHVLSPAAFAGLASPAIHAVVAFLLLSFLPARRVDA